MEKVRELYKLTESVVINYFYAKRGACEGAEHLLSQHAAFILVTGLRQWTY
jgi:hypothetical protein